jgi:type IV secretory pathway component VirB8
MPFEAQEWMHEQQTKLERREAFRFWSMLIFTLIAAVAACIAAEPVVKDWIWPTTH